MLSPSLTHTEPNCIQRIYHQKKDEFQVGIIIGNVICVFINEFIIAVIAFVILPILKKRKT